MILEQLGRYSNAGTEYLNSPISQPARDKRGGNNDFSGVNYATFYYVEGPGAPLTEITASSDRYHSEKHCWLELCRIKPVFQALRVTSWKEGDFGGTLTPSQLHLTSGAYIHSVYTERDVCSGCSPLLQEIMDAGAKVYWSFVYPSADTSKFQQPPEQVGIFGLLTLATGDSHNYAQVVKDNVRDGRVIGNKQLKDALK